MSRGLMEFTTGFLGGLSDIAADKKAKDDLYASKTLDLEFRGKEKEQDFKFSQKELELQRERRKEGLIGLGFTEEYLDQFGQFALESDSNLSAWLEMNQNFYDNPFWHTTPIKFHHDPKYIGKTVQDLKLDMNNTNKVFDNKKVVDSTKSENNLTDNIADSQFDNTSVSGNQISGGGSYSLGTYAGAELFHGKKKYGTGDNQIFITEDGRTANAFRIEQTAGQKDYGENYYVNTANGLVTLNNYFGNTPYFDINSEIGKDFAKTAFPTVQSQEPMSYLFSINNNQYVLHGKNTTYTDGRIEQTINHVPYNLSQIIPQLRTSEYFAAEPEGPPGSGFMTDDEMKYYEVDVEKLRGDLSGSGIQFTLNPFKDQASFTLAETIGGKKEPKDLNLVDKNRMVTSDLVPALGLGFSGDQIRYNDITGELEPNVFGNEPDEQFNAKIVSSIINDVVQQWTTNSINDEFSTKLGFNNSSLNANDSNISLLGSKVGITINNIHRNVRGYYQDLLMGYNEQQFEEWRNANGIGEEEVSQTKDSIDKFAFTELASANTMQDLFAINDIINRERANDFDASVESAFSSLPGAEGNVQTGMDVITGIIKSTMSKNISDTQLLTDEIRDLVGGDANKANLIVNSDFVVKQIANLDPDTLPDTPIKEVEEQEETRTEQIEALDVEDWLRQDSVSPIPTIPSEASEWREANASDPNVKNAGGGQGSLYDKDTGFQIFKSPDLPPNHVEPRPGGDSPNAKAGFGSKITQNWDLLYSKTHNADGTPKTQE